MKKLLFLLSVMTLLTACGSIYEQEPVGIGTADEELKRSPCACMLLELPKELPAWLQNKAS
ncbi:MAG: hypothetical protein MJ247_07025 [Alphaproteobacteria bacterium]|nr:hypothetical protein [Alphaproteobacteria bacterium]